MTLEDRLRAQLLGGRGSKKKEALGERKAHEYPTVEIAVRIPPAYKQLL